MNVFPTCLYGLSLFIFEKFANYIIFLLLLPRFSESMLLLRAQNVGLVVTWVPMVFVAMNIVYAPIAVAAGLMSDSNAIRRCRAASSCERAFAASASACITIFRRATSAAA